MKQDLFKAYKDNLERIREEYPILHEYSDLWAMEVYRQLKEEGSLLTEFLKTVDPKVTMRQLQARLGHFYHEISPEGVDSSFIKIIFQPGEEKVKFYEAVEMLDKFGWYPAATVTYGFDKYSPENVVSNLKKGEEVMVIFEPTHDPEQPIPSYLYHITSQVYADSIDKIGLVPKTHSKLAKHPGRVYLLGSKSGGADEVDELTLSRFARELYYAMKKDAKDRTGAMIVYRVDTRKVPNLRLHEDPNFSPMFVRGYYTYTNMPPSAMTKIHAFDVSNF